MGRDVGRDEGREQAEWRDLVARLEGQAPIDAAEAPWPDRENLRAKTQPGSPGTTGDSGSSGQAADSAASGPGDGRPGNGQPGDQRPRDESTDGGAGSDTGHDHDDAGQDHRDDGDASHGGRPSADRGRVIRPAGLKRSDGQAEPAAAPGTQGSQGPAPEAEAAAGIPGVGDPALAGPRDYELDEPSDDDLAGEYDDRYIPPPLPPQPGLDPVAKGAWLALFGGPGYLLIATLLSWQIAGWAALAAVIAFIAGFVVLVFRLGDGPSKRDGPDQGAVV
ncbi:MAG TPA: hypothetical protein VEV63_13575 [Streptosporangiaceae bacterium]|nr:hypothetical protein [Streptosporangiaceae bacterium]